MGNWRLRDANLASHRVMWGLWEGQVMVLHPCREACGGQEGTGIGKVSVPVEPLRPGWTRPSYAGNRALSLRQTRAQLLSEASTAPCRSGTGEALSPQPSPNQNQSEMS